MKKNIPLIALLALSLVVHFAWFGHPNTTVFDEVHFGKFISAYFTHEYYFDIHPPLGKLILAGWGKLWGFRPGFSFAQIGDVFPDRTYLALRFLPTLAGVLLPLVIYGLARQLKMSRAASLFAGALIALDNALLVQSRLILLDSFLLLFGFSAVYCYLRWRSSSSTNYWLLVASGILGGMAMSIKWTGATFLALIVILEALRLWHDRHHVAIRRSALAPLAALVAIPFLIYYAAFAAHFALLTKPGPGDAFMSPQFRQGELSTAEKFTELNAQMYDSNQRLTATHPYSSKWYTWPFMVRPIFYWVKDSSRIYLLGNPVVWWGSTIALAVALVELLAAGIRRANRTLIIMIGAWAMNLLPFIGISRVMFLYHYFTALIWAVLIMAYEVDRTRRPQRAALGLIALALTAFLFFAPLSYGLPLSPSAYRARVWLSSWQ
jgi:dolichyl-phosphate-mannose-protein mannosyltransferase